MKEEWKEIENYENYYVSNKGQIIIKERKTSNGRILKEKIIKQTKTQKGYLRVQLYKNGKNKAEYVHRIVAKHFIKNKENKPQVNHIDGNKENNCINNLEWCTNSENQLHAYKNNLNKFNENNRIATKNNLKLGSISKRKKVSKLDKETLETIEIFNSITEAGKSVSNAKNFGTGHISKACKTNTIKFGYRWKYIE